MKLLISVILLITLLGACCPCRNLENTSDTTTVYSRDTIYEPDSIYFTLDPDTVTDSVLVKVLIDNKGHQVVSSDTVEVSSNYANAKSWVKNSQLKLVIFDKDTTLVITNDSLKQVIRDKETTLINQTKVIEQKQSMIERLKHNIRLVLIGAVLSIFILLVVIPFIRRYVPRKR